MTNLEESKGRIINETWFCRAAHICRYGVDCIDISCKDCEFYKDTGECIKAMLADRKEPIKLKPIKLKRWEFDLLSMCYKVETHLVNKVVSSYWPVTHMMDLGYFRGIKDKEMDVADILENCKVIEDD